MYWRAKTCENVRVMVFGTRGIITKNLAGKVILMAKVMEIVKEIIGIQEIMKLAIEVQEIIEELIEMLI